MVYQIAARRHPKSVYLDACRIHLEVQRGLVMPEYESWIEYRDVVGFEGSYKISSDGTVWSCLITGKSQGRATRPWRQLKLSENQSNRYLCIALSRPGVPIARVGVHVLVAY